MPFTNKPQVFNAKINPITVGADGHEMTLGGSNVYPLYSFDAPIENAPKVGLQVSDKGFDAALPEMAKFYEGCNTVVERAVRAAGANVLVAGNAVFSSEDMRAAIDAIRGEPRSV